MNRTGHDLPADKQTDNGESHANFLRKTQSSFSWDWGPTFAIQGVAGPAYITYFNDADIYRVSPVITKGQSDNFFNLQVDTFVFCHSGSSVTVSINITEINVATTQSFSNINCDGPITNLSINLNVPDSTIQRWWPNGYGNQSLYTLVTQILVNGNSVAQKSLSLGFRTVELVQDLIDPNNPNTGRTFYFKINDVPIFLKGSNFIPIDPFPARNHTLRKQFLFKSMHVANLNTIRIWGGGLFETDEFYKFADQYGVLLWHDHMFACSEYPAEDDFFALVKAEITEQVTRLRYHPSILTWAGNNEDELGVRSWWGYVSNYPESQQIADYVALTVTLMKPLINSLDPSRPFLISSPSNGVDSEKEGGVAQDPNSQNFGDIHYYDYSSNLWKDSTFVAPRCTTEFGIQALPLATTMGNWINASEWTYGSYWNQQRQHHPGGNSQNLNLVFQHFEIPSQCPGYTKDNAGSCSYVTNSTQFIAEFAYLSQVFQAIGIQTESEHYRRYRSILTSDGRGGTMCALYWQLNDVWAAPTWSSIDYDLNWKVLHYYANRFFAPVIVSPYLDGNNQLQVYLVSDLQTPLNNYIFILDVFTWETGFTPIFTTIKTVNIPSLNNSVVSVQSDLSANNITLNDNDVFIIRAAIYDPQINRVSPYAILLPDKLNQISNFYYGDATITNMTLVDACSLNDCYTTYEIVLEATKLVPGVWLDIKPETKTNNQLLYWFTDNAFTMTQPKVTVFLKIFSSNGNGLSIGDLTVSRIKMSSNQTTTSGPTVNSCPVNWYASSVNTKSCYNINVNLTWNQASTVCTELSSNANLISIDNAFSNTDVKNFVQKFAPACTKSYIGLHKTTDWVWTNGDNSTYRNWQNGYPSNDQNSLCVFLNQNDGTWTNQNCDIPNCYICQINF